ncbi:MAG: GGDEF domain-containing protein [Nitrospirae bacterium]|nr:GGDEF domain-containing protein [Nitrospirota bacterium]
MIKDAGLIINALKHVKKNPKYVLKLFTLFSIFSIATILLLVGIGLYKINYDYIIRNAEDNAIRIAYTIFDQERKYLLSTDASGKATIHVKEEAFAMLDDRMKKYLHPLNMFKIKFFSTDTKIVYSTDHSIIGKTDKTNQALAKALRGQTDSKIVQKGSVLDLAGEKRYEVDVVETYLPIIDDNHDIVGSFEVYIDVTHSYQEIRKVVTYSVVVLSVVLVFVFGVLYFLMSRITGQLSKTQEELHLMAITDGLTKLYNRRYMILRVEEEFDRVTRKKVPSMGLIMADIDYFKKINDNYGHLTGDEVLKEVAHRIKTSVRKYDMVGRYGGEEFLILLPNSSIEETKLVAERIWNAVREKSVGQCKVTLSLGATCTVGNEELNSAINRADEGLYKSKQAGRDRISLT